MAKSGSPYITTGERVRSYLGWAFVISLVAHFAIGSILPNFAQRHEEQQVEKVTMAKKTRVRVPTPPPPTPTPPPSPTPKPETTPPPKQQHVVQPKLKVNLVHTTSKSASGSTENTVAQPKTGSENGAPQGQGTGPPAPATAPPGTPKPACANPNVEATVTNPVQPDYPESARDLGLGAVTVEVEVTVAPSGNLVDAKIYKSSSNMSIDQAALRAARQSTYSPKLVGCQPTQGDYLFRADFQPD